MKKYRAIHNIKLLNPTKVKGKVREYPEIQGRDFEDKNVDGIASVGALVLSGSVLELELSPRKESILIRMGALAFMDSPLHINLESVFGPEVAEVLRKGEVYTLEDVANGKKAKLLFTDKEIPLDEYLQMEGDQEQIKTWIDACKAAIKRK